MQLKSAVGWYPNHITMCLGTVSTEKTATSAGNAGSQATAKTSVANLDFTNAPERMKPNCGNQRAVDTWGTGKIAVRLSSEREICGFQDPVSGMKTELAPHEESRASLGFHVESSVMNVPLKKIVSSLKTKNSGNNFP